MSDETTTEASILTDVAEPSLADAVAQVFGPDAAPPPAVEAPAEPVEAAPEPPKDPAVERASARVLANIKAEARAAKVRAEIAAQRAEVEAERAKVSEEAKLADLVKAAKSSPSKALELLGFKPGDFLKSLALENEPEAIAMRAMEGTQTELQKLQAKVEAMEAERAAAAEQRLVAMRQETTQAGGDAFLDFVASNADKYPNLVEAMTPAEMVNEGFAILDEVVGKDASGKPVTRLQAYQAEHGKPPEDSDIAEFLEHRATPRAQARSAWRERIGKSAPQQASQAIPSGDVRATQMDRGPSPRTLTSRAAAERGAVPGPKTQEEIDAECIRMLQASMSKAG